MICIHQRKSPLPQWLNVHHYDTTLHTIDHCLPDVMPMLVVSGERQPDGLTLGESVFHDRGCKKPSILRAMGYGRYPIFSVTIANFFIFLTGITSLLWLLVFLFWMTHQWRLRKEKKEREYIVNIGRRRGVEKWVIYDIFQ